MAKITAVAKLNGKTPTQDLVHLSFAPDYNDERNKAWAKYTPSLSLQLNVLPEVAENFETGKNYLLTFDELE